MLIICRPKTWSFITKTPDELTTPPLPTFGNEEDPILTGDCGMSQL